MTQKNEVIVNTLFDTLEKDITHYQAKSRMTMNKYYYFVGYGSERTDILNKLLLNRIEKERGEKEIK